MKKKAKSNRTADKISEQTSRKYNLANNILQCNYTIEWKRDHNTENQTSTKRKNVIVIAKTLSKETIFSWSDICHHFCHEILISNEIRFKSVGALPPRDLCYARCEKDDWDYPCSNKLNSTWWDNNLLLLCFFNFKIRFNFYIFFYI